MIHKYINKCLRLYVVDAIFQRRWYFILHLFENNFEMTRFWAKNVFLAEWIILVIFDTQWIMHKENLWLWGIPKRSDLRWWNPFLIWECNVFVFMYKSLVWLRSSFMSFSHFKKRIFLNLNISEMIWIQCCDYMCVCLCMFVSCVPNTNTHTNAWWRCWQYITKWWISQALTNERKLHMLAIFNSLCVWVEREWVSVVMIYICVKSSVQKSLEMNVLFIKRKYGKTYSLAQFSFGFKIILKQSTFVLKSQNITNFKISWKFTEWDKKRMRKKMSVFFYDNERNWRSRNINKFLLITFPTYYETVEIASCQWA